MSAASFTTAGGTGGSFSNPIVGDTELTTLLLHNAYMTTGDLLPGDAGNASGLSGVTLELWLRMTNDATPASTEVLLEGPEVSAGVRQYALSLSTTGMLSVTVRHATSGAITATATTALVDATWYHVVALVLGSSLILYVNGVAAATTAWPAGVVTAAAGLGTSDLRVGHTANPENFEAANLAFYRYGLPAARVLAHYQAGTQRGFPTQATGARINAVLDSAGSTAPRRIQTGVRSVTPSYMRGQTPKSEIDKALSAEAVDAAFYTAADGTLVSLDSAHRSSSPYNTSQATFGDGAGELPYTDVNVVYDESNLANEWNGTMEGASATPGLTQTVSDATSISRYFKRSQSLTSIPVPADSDALDIVTAYLAKYKDPLYRITQLTFNTIDASAAEAIFRREIGDKITVLRTPPGGGSRISQVLWIQKIDVAGANDGNAWTVTWGVSPV